MDSVNPLESQCSPLNFRSTASNTTPFRCPCGGFNEYAQAFPQAYCFRPPNLGQSQCKHSQDAEEKFPMQQHFYSSLPFLSPFFYNNPITNLYCPHNPAPETPPKEQQKQPTQESGHVFHQKENSLRVNNGTTEEDTPQNNNVLEPEPQFFCHPWCSLNTNNKPAAPGCGLQRCGCGDSLPWTCSSFIVPMITYCVIWKSNLNTSSGNSREPCQQNKATGSEPNTSTDLPPSASQTNVFNNNSTQIVDDNLGVDEVTNIQWRNQEGVEDIDQITTRSFKSLTSSFDKESGYDNTEENSEKNAMHLEGGSDESEDDEDEDEAEEDGETDDWAEEDKNEEEETTNVYFSNETQSFMKPFDSQPPSAPGSYTDLKQLEKSKAPATGLSCTDMKTNPSDSTAEGEKAFRSRITNHNVQEKFDQQKTHVRQAVCIKKFINNFTMTDQTNHVHEEAQKSAAAAGDLGGVNCVGYRINVSNCFDDREFEILKRTQTVENAKAKEIYVEDLPHPEEGNNPTKISDKTTKNVRHFRSGIAKLLTSSKLKDAKADPPKNTKTEAREQVQRELTVGKRKHSCFSADTTMGTNEYSKTQKTKNHRLTQGPEKQQQKTKSSNNETPRKEEKHLKVKINKDAGKK